MATSADFPTGTLDKYDAVIAEVPGVVRKGAASAYTSRNGHMFSFLMKNGRLALRLSPDDQAAFVKKHKTKPVVQYGAVMRGYVDVPATLLKRTKTLAKYFMASYDYIGSLKPKPTKRPTKKKATKKKATKKKTAAKKKRARR